MISLNCSPTGSGAHSAGIRQGLLERGWVENTDHNSLFFDLKVGKFDDV